MFVEQPVALPGTDYLILPGSACVINLTKVVPNFFFFFAFYLLILLLYLFVQKIQLKVAR